MIAGPRENNLRAEITPNKFRKYLSLLFLFLAITFIGYVHIQATITSGWSDTRVLGFSQKSVCNDLAGSYSVMSNVTVHVSNSPILVPATCVYMKYGGNHFICVTSYSLLQHIIDPAFAYIYVDAPLDYIYPAQRGYIDRGMFPFGIWLWVLCTTSVITDFYSDTPVQTPNALQTKIFLRRLTVALGIIIGIGLLFSAQNYTTIRSEVCRDDNAPYQFCADLKANGVIVKSIVYPTDTFVKNYSSICFLLSSGIIFSTILRSFLTDDVGPSTIFTENDVRRARRLRIRENNNNQNGINALISFLYRHRDHQQANDDDDDDVEIIELPSTDSWKFFRYSPDSSIVDCAICLGRFSVDPGLSVVDLDDCDVATGVKSKPIPSEVTIVGVPTSVSSAPTASPIVDDALSPRENSHPEAAICQIPCGHIFHRNCILNWTLETATRERASQRNLTCPICRSSLV